MMYPNNFNPNQQSQNAYGFQQAQQYAPQYYSTGYAPTTYGYQPPVTQRTSQPLPNVPRSAINGRVVGTEAEITPQEIPMDGSISIFPSSDYSCIYGKTWDSDGHIRTCKYIPAVEAQMEAPAQNDFEAKIMQRLDELENMLANALPKTRTAKKEENGNA